ncbi:nucleic acid-binding protein [Natronobacterium gregoryi SP2]|uniref:Nucleic acid-binding protein n=1 Tax=Natronobacterium gregoryi (strain ATCC 43098 / DSM 3393 / CCM 3738 / CIP 104747 / IAM 13177 / JCM 8860 / NBRC 102187 / NCIMB 2189 / SP2) TaxID=797304 RepID=L9YED8_NATGS|nr:nucleic acid-binding protein [Natronobacterium gregoryi SP2]
MFDGRLTAIGRAIGIGETIVGATALVHEESVLTRTVAHFERTTDSTASRTTRPRHWDRVPEQPENSTLKGEHAKRAGNATVPRVSRQRALRGHLQAQPDGCRHDFVVQRALRGRHQRWVSALDDEADGRLPLELHAS